MPLLSWSAWLTSQGFESGLGPCVAGEQVRCRIPSIEASQALRPGARAPALLGAALACFLQGQDRISRGVNSGSCELSRAIRIEPCGWLPSLDASKRSPW